MKSDITYLLVLTAVLGVYVVSFFKRWSFGIEGYTVWALMFTTLLIMVTMKVSICNPLLEWFGKHIFSIYILQRIPMTLLAHFGCVESHKYISLIVVFAVTMVMALLFEKVGAIEKRHEERYLTHLGEVRNATVFASDNATTRWICLNCGHVLTAKEPPQICPVCAHPRAYFSKDASYM
jgi:hypothetical protein